MSAPGEKLRRLLELMEKEEWAKALKLAAAFPRLGRHKEQIQRGWAACSSPRFYLQLGENPEQLVEAGILALRERYGKEKSQC